MSNDTKTSDEDKNTPWTQNDSPSGKKNGLKCFIHYAPSTFILLVVIIVLVIRLRKVNKKIKVMKRQRRDDANEGCREGVHNVSYQNVNDLITNQGSRTPLFLRSVSRFMKRDSLPAIPGGDHGKVEDMLSESEKSVKNPLYFYLEETANGRGSKQAAKALGKKDDDGAIREDDEKRSGNSNVVVATLHQSPSSTPPPLIVDHVYDTMEETRPCKLEDGPSASRSRQESESDLTTSPYDKLNRGFILG